jgi:MFS family permease
VIRKMFAYRDFRAAAVGDFGHMWELYAFWAFVAVFRSEFLAERGLRGQVSAWSFGLIAAGSLGCVLGGYVSLRRGSARVAFAMLLTSGAFCLFSPWLFLYLPPVALLGALFLWGFAVVGDSPQFSTLVARTAPGDYVGSALTLVNCLGFSITILSIQLLSWVQIQFPARWLFLPLTLGPVFGLWAIRRAPTEK